MCKSVILVHITHCIGGFDYVFRDSVILHSMNFFFIRVVGSLFICSVFAKLKFIRL